MEERTFRLSLGETEAAVEFIKDAASKFHLPEDKLSRLLIACEEWFVNCCRHGGNEKEDGSVNVSLSREGDSLYVKFTDAREPFDPTGYPAPDMNIPIEDKHPGGLGIHLMRKLTDGISWRREGTRNVLTMTIRLPKE